MRCRILAAALLLSLSPVSQAGQIYKWVDAQGQTHFDAQPPTGQSAQQISVQQAPASPAISPPKGNAQGDQKAINAKVKTQIADQEAKRAKYCEDVRTNLAQYQNNPRIHEEVKGEVRRLTEEERQARIAATEKAIKDNCQ
jgi:cytochrome c556